MSNFRIRNGGSVFFTYIKGPLPEGNNHIGSVDISGGLTNTYVTVSGPLPAGNNNIGTVNIAGGSVVVDVSSLNIGTVTVSGPLPTGYNHIGNVDISSFNATNFQNKNTVMGKVMFADSANNDAFGRLRTSNPETLFEGSLISGQQNEFFDISQFNGAIATYNSNESTMSFDVSRAGQFVKRQSHYFTHYQPGKSLVIVMSFYFGSNNPAGSYKRVGLFDDNEGIYLEQTSSNLSWNILSQSAATTFTANQSDWNIDTLQGTGPSGLTLNIQQTNLIFIDLEWLGVGRIRVGFVIGGKIIYCHEFVINNLTVPYIKSPYLPMRYQIGTSVNQASTVTMKQICCTAFSEGGFQPIGNVRSYIMENTRRLIAGGYTPLISIRLKQQYKTSQIVPISYTVFFPTGNETILTKIILRPSLTGAIWNSASDYAEVDLSATSLSGGYEINSSYITSQVRVNFSDQPASTLNVQSNINGVCDILTIACKSTQVGGTQPDLYACLDWREII